jgi:Ca-activated chloride channel family protein
MLATDQKPNRLQLVKEKIKKLLSNLSCERVGLVLFSGASLMQCPLTKDYHAFCMFLDQMSIESISSGSTALDQPIETALKVFKDVSNSATKLLVLFTDGEDFAGNVKALQSKIAEENLCIVTCGVGTVHGAPIPVLTDEGRQVGYEKDAQGNIIMSCLNEPLLQQIAQDSGGTYVHIQQNSDDDLVTIIHKVESFEKYQMQERQVSTLQEQYPYFVAASLVCFLLEWIL